MSKLKEYLNKKENINEERIVGEEGAYDIANEIVTLISDKLVDGDSIMFNVGTHTYAEFEFGRYRVSVRRRK